MTRLNAPAGRPARLMISDNAQAQPGVDLRGLEHDGVSVGRAGAIFQDGIAIGKFQGVMSATTPIGSRVTSTVTPGRTEGINSPAVRSASPAKNLKIWPARPTRRAPRAVFALFTRQQIAKFGLTRQDFRADAIEGVGALLNRRGRPRGKGTDAAVIAAVASS